MGKLYILMGITASGKDTVLNQMVNVYDIARLVSNTTRPMRQGETNGVEYNFVTKEQFDEDIANDQVIEHREYNVASGETWYYYFKKGEINLASNNDYCCIADVQGTSELVKYYGKANTVVIWLTTPQNICLIRALNRENLLGKIDKDSIAKTKEVCRRMISDIEMFIENPKAVEITDSSFPVSTPEEVNTFIGGILSGFTVDSVMYYHGYKNDKRKARIDD